MNIFSKRPLFISCLIFIACAVLGVFIPGCFKLILALICAISLIFCLIILFVRYFSSNKRNLLLCLILCFIMSVASLCSSYLFFDLNDDAYESMYGNECMIDAVVTEKNQVSVFQSQYTVTVEAINGQKAWHKARLTLDFAGGLEIGDKIKAKVTATDPEDDLISDEIKNMLKSEGIFITYVCESEDSIDVSHHSDAGIELFFININRKCSSILENTVGGEAGNLSSALLLGNKDLLASSVKRDFSRAGASHILALSGMHMSIIMGVFMFILKKITSKTYLIAVILTVIAIAYLLLTGMSVSATRAVLMLLVVYISWICFGTSDSLTSLSIAGAAILLISPGSVYDGGFWMSFGATFGILAFMQPLNDYFNECLAKYDNKFKYATHKILYSIITAFATGMAALTPLIIVMCFFTKEISVFSVLSSVVLSIPTASIILLSLILLPLSGVPFVSDIIAWLIRLAATVMFDYCELVSLLENTVISVNYPFAAFMAVILGIALFFCFASKRFNPFKSLIPFAICIVLFIGIAVGYEHVNADQVKVTYINASSNSDMLVVSSEREAVICEISNGSATSYSKALEELEEVRATEVKAIILTRYMNSNVATLYQVFQGYRVREIWMPMPSSSDELYLMERLCEFAKANDVKAYVYEYGEAMHIFNTVSIDVQRDYIERSSVPVSLISVSSGSQLVTYASPAFNESELKDEAEYLFAKSHYIIFGNRGPKTKTAYTVPSEKKLLAIVFAGDTQIAYFNEPEHILASYYKAQKKIEFFLDK